MQLADATWRRTPPDGTAGPETWEEATADVRATVDIGSDRLYALLPRGHQKTLRAVATSGSIYGTAAGVLELSPGTAKAAADALTGNGFLVRRDDQLTVVDPLLADWIRRRFPL